MRESGALVRGAAAPPKPRFKHAKLTAAEEAGLGQIKVWSENDLWQEVGRDFDLGLEKLAKKSGITRDRLISILTDCVVQELEPSSRLQRATRHGLDWVVLSCVLVLTFLYLRAEGCLSVLPAPLGLRERVPIVAGDLHKGQVLRRSDFLEIWCNPAPQQFREIREIKGLRLNQDLPSGSSIYFKDVLREQWIARGDIGRGSGIRVGAVGAQWTTYEPNAVLDRRKIIGRRALRTIRKGDVISSQDLAPLQRKSRSRAKAPSPPGPGA